MGARQGLRGFLYFSQMLRVGIGAVVGRTGIEDGFVTGALEVANPTIGLFGGGIFLIFGAALRIVDADCFLNIFSDFRLAFGGFLSNN